MKLRHCPLIRASFPREKNPVSREGMDSRMDARSDQVPHPGIAALVESLGTQKKPPAKSLHGSRNVIFFQTARRHAEVKRKNLKEYIPEC